MRRALLVAAAVLSVAFATPATAWPPYTSQSCPAESSTRLVTSTTPFGPLRLWVHEQPIRDVVVCFQLGTTAAGAFVVKGPDASIGMPTVTPGSNPALCDTTAFYLADPVELRVATGDAYCLTVAGVTLTVSATTGIGPGGVVPRHELWLDPETDLLFLVCTEQYGDDPEGFDACYDNPHRVDAGDFP